MKPTCPPTEVLLGLLDGDAGDPLWSHVHGCPRCRSRIASYRLFTSGAAADAPSRPGEDAAAKRLSRVLHERIHGEDPYRRSASDWWARIRRAWVPALGGAMVVVGAVLLIRNEGPALLSRGDVLRGSRPSSGRALSDAALVVHPPILRDDGSVEMRWQPSRSADSYLVRILDAGFREMTRIPAGRDTVLVLSAERLRALVGSDGTYWMVQATSAGDPVAETVPSPLPDGRR